MDSIGIPGSNREVSLEGCRAGDAENGIFETVTEIKALSEFGMNWRDIRAGLSQVDEENKKYQFAVRGESLEDYEIDVIELDDRY